MSTRAIITKNGKEFIATHFDGYPEGLGEDLIGKFTDEEIKEAASRHNISFIEGGKPTTQTIRPDIMISGSRMLAAQDYPTCDIANYDDFAEYQYDLKDGKWQFRPRWSSWQKAKNKPGKFYPLTKKGIEEYYKENSEE
jgi:hypothetical protein